MTMIDKKLLELAAKAAGISIVWDNGWRCYMRDARPVQKFDSEWLPWRPLTDDGDALRLAVKISEVQGYFPLMIDKICAKTSTPEGAYIVEHVPIGGCFAQATRRAIVRAAAAIGESL